MNDSAQRVDIIVEGLSVFLTNPLVISTKEKDSEVVAVACN